MRKRNKILMMVVSSLLCLTLISSCLVSSVFAKFVTKDTAIVPISFKKMGVEVGMTIDEAKLRSVLGDAACAANLTSPTQAEKNAGKVWLETSTDNQIKAGINTITIRNLALKPGDDLTDFVVFTIGGTANVKCKMTVDVDIAYDIENFHIPMDKAKEFGWTFGYECYAMPLEFSYNFSDDDGKEAYPYELPSYNSFEFGYFTEYDLHYECLFYTMAKNPSSHPDSNPTLIDPKATFYWSDDKKECYIEKEFDVGSEVCLYAGDTRYQEVAVTNMTYGVKWPFTYTGSYSNIDVNALEVFLVDEKQPTIDLSYTVRVEQIDPNAT